MLALKLIFAAKLILAATYLTVGGIIVGRACVARARSRATWAELDRVVAELKRPIPCRDPINMRPWVRTSLEETMVPFVEAFRKLGI